MVKVDPKAPVTLELLNDAVDTITEGMDAMMEKIDQRFDELGRRVDKVPSRMEFEILRGRVERLERLAQAS